MSNKTNRRQSQVIVSVRKGVDAGPTQRNVQNLEIDMNFDSESESNYTSASDAQRTSAFSQARCKKTFLIFKLADRGRIVLMAMFVPI